MSARFSRTTALVFTFAFLFQSTVALLAAPSAQAQAYDPSTRRVFEDYASAQTYCHTAFKDLQLSNGQSADGVVRPDSVYTSQSNSQLHATFYLRPNSQYWNYPGAAPAFYCLYDAIKSGWKDRDDPNAATAIIDTRALFNPTPTTAGLPATVTVGTSLADAEKICNGPVVWQLTQLSRAVAAYLPQQQFMTFYAQTNNPGWEDKTLGDQYQCNARLQQPSAQYYQLLQNFNLSGLQQCAGSFYSCSVTLKGELMFFCEKQLGTCPAKIVALLNAKSETEFNALLAAGSVSAPVPPAPPQQAPPPPPANAVAGGYDTNTRQAFGTEGAAVAYCPQHFTPGDYVRTVPGSDGKKYYRRSKTPDNIWRTGDPAFYCLYDAVKSNWQDAFGNPVPQVSLGSSTPVTASSVRSTFTTYAEAATYCAATFTPNDVARLDSVYTSQSNSQLHATFYVRKSAAYQSPHWNDPGASDTFYCLHDALALGWKDRDDPAQATYQLATDLFQTASDPAHKLADAIYSCHGQSNVVWVLDQYSHDANLTNGSTGQMITLFVRSDESRWQEKDTANSGRANYYACSNAVPAPALDLAEATTQLFAGNARYCATGFAACTPPKKQQMLAFCNTTPNQCTVLEVHLLGAPSQVAYDHILNPPPPVVAPPALNPLSASAGLPTSGTVGPVYHLDRVHQYSPPSASTLTIILQKGGQMIGYQFSPIVASGGGNIVASGGGNIIPHRGGSFTLLLPDGQSFIIASGGGNIIASGGGNIIASGGGNIIASGGGNIIASGGGNFTVNGLIAPGGGLVARALAAVVSNDGATVISNDGGTLLGNGGNLASLGNFEMNTDTAGILNANGNGVISTNGSNFAFPNGAGFRIKSLDDVDQGPAINLHAADAFRVCGDGPGAKLKDLKTVFALFGPESYALLSDVPPARFATLHIRGYACLRAVQAASWTHNAHP